MIFLFKQISSGGLTDWTEPKCVLTLTVRSRLEKKKTFKSVRTRPKAENSATTGERELSSARRAYKCQTFFIED